MTDINLGLVRRCKMRDREAFSRLPPPTEIVLCRESVLQACFESEAEGKDFALTDLVN